MEKTKLQSKEKDLVLLSNSAETNVGPAGRRVTRVTPVTLAGTFFGQLTLETRKQYSYSLRSFGEWLGTGDDVALTAARLCEMSEGEGNITLMQYCEAKFAKLRPSTQNGRLQGVRSLMRLACMVGLATWKPGIPRKKVEKMRDTRGPGREKVIQLIAAESEKKTRAGARNVALIRLNYDLALRRTSILSIDLKDWERKSRCIWVTTKGRVEPRRKDLPDATQAALERWVEIRGNHPGPLFCRIRRGDKLEVLSRLSADGYYRVLKTLACSIHVAGDRPVKPHGIRHSAITQAAKVARTNNLGLAAVMAFSDHANVATLSHYLDAEDQIQKRISELVANDAGEAAG